MFPETETSLILMEPSIGKLSNLKISSLLFIKNTSSNEDRQSHDYYKKRSNSFELLP